MSVVIVGVAFLYGDPLDKPTLPIGWNYIAKKGEWLLAESPEGKRYFVSPATSEKPTVFTRCKTAGILDVIRTFRRLRFGQKYVDQTETLSFT